MADAARFDIDIEANNLGVDASAAELNAFGNKIQFVNAVATTFDKAVAAARARLEESAAAAKNAAAALAVAETRYRELESAANKAAKEVEKATLAGKDTTALQAASTAAASKMREQAAAVDALRVKSDQAAAAQSKLAGTLKTLEGQQAAQVASIKKGQEAAKAASGSMDALASPDKVSRFSALKDKVAALGGVQKLAALGFLAMAAAAVIGVGAMAKFAVESNPAAMMKLTLASQRMSLGIKSLFSGLKLGPFVGALEDIMSLFDKGTSSANGMKKLVETILQPLFDGAAKAGPYVKEMFKGLIFGALQVVIAVLKIRNEIFRAMSPETRAQIKSVMDHVLTLENAFKLGTATAIVLTAVMIGLAVAVLAASWPILLVVAAVAAVIAILMNWGAIVDWLKGMWDGFVAFIKRIPEAWVNAAKAMIDGLVKGIKDGAAAVWKAMQDLAGGAIDAFKSKLGIKSPSVVMAMQATHTVAGFVDGIEAGAPEAQSALESMVSPPEPSAPSGGKVTASPSSGGGPLIGSLTVHANTKEDAQGIVDAILDTLEKVGVTLGRGTPAGAT